MKIVMINGSPRKNGITSLILKNYENILTKKGANTELIHIVDTNMKQCLGCCQCFKLGRCVLNDEIDEISKRIGEADAFIIASPTYASNVSGQLKIFIDRGHFVIEQLLRNKPCIAIATGENYGKGDVIRILKKLIKYSGGIISSSFSIKVPFANQKQLKNSLIEKCSNSADRLIKEITKPKIHLLQKLIHFVVFYVGIKPFVYKKKESYNGVIEKWKLNGTIE